VRARILYGVFGAAVLAAALVPEWRGWTFGRARHQQVLPRSVRENPGAYRTVYRGPYRYLRGK
jgi:hypothetical protein